MNTLVLTITENDCLKSKKFLDESLGVPIIRLWKFISPANWIEAKEEVRRLFSEGHGRVVVDAPNNTKALRNWWKDAEWVTEYKVFEYWTEKSLIAMILGRRELSHLRDDAVLFELRTKESISRVPMKRYFPKLDKLAEGFPPVADNDYCGEHKLSKEG